MKNVQGKFKKLMDSKTIEEYKEKVNIHYNDELFDHLMKLLRNLINCTFDDSLSEEAYFGIYKLLDFLDETLEVVEKKERLNTVNIYYLVEEVVAKIKQIDKHKRNCNKKITLYREIANRLDNIELNINYKLKENQINNYNIIKYILMDIKDITSSHKLIKEYAYLINAYNCTNENILNTLINEYIKELNNYLSEDINYNLCYYESVISTIFENDKIKIDENVLSKNIDKCLKAIDNKKELDEKERMKEINWINHLINILEDRSYIPSIDTINNLYNIRFYFKKPIEDEGNICYKKNKSKLILPQQEDFIISIDDEDNKNKDDAMSIEKQNDLYNLKIYIADPNTFCGMDSLLIKEARKRSQSIYLEDRTIELFPTKVITDYLSLEESKPRFSRVYNYLIDECGEVIDFKIEKKIITVNKNLVYEDVNANTYQDEKVISTLEQLQIIKNLINNRYNNIDEINSQSLIEVLMMFNNIQVAKYFAQHKIPFIYRHFGYKKNEYFKDIDIDDQNIKRIIKVINSINSSAYFSSAISFHDAIKTDYYCYSTSPNRRYSDILVNECQDKFYFSKMKDKDYYKFEEYLRQEIDYLNQKDLQIAEYYKRYARTLNR